MSVHKIPPGSTDTHLHIYEPVYPLKPESSGMEDAATLADYRREMGRMGIERAVIIQPSAYGDDNRCTLQALAALGSAARAVIILAEDVSDATITHFSEKGVVGLRCLMDFPGAMMDWPRTARMAPRFVEHGWHLNIQFPGSQFVEREAALRALPGTLVIDHLGKFIGATDPDGPNMAAFLRLLDTGRVWVKLSAPYHADRSGPPDYADVNELARRLVHHAPERCLWASNWPHPGRHPRPDNVSLLQLLTSWTDDVDVRNRILVDNPRALYGFDE
jgi:D-galactarolactone isomerase